MVVQDRTVTARLILIARYYIVSNLELPDRHDWSSVLPSFCNPKRWWCRGSFDYLVLIGERINQVVQRLAVMVERLHVVCIHRAGTCTNQIDSRHLLPRFLQKLLRLEPAPGSVLGSMHQDEMTLGRQLHPPGRLFDFRQRPPNLWTWSLTFESATDRRALSITRELQLIPAKIITRLLKPTIGAEDLQLRLGSSRRRAYRPFPKCRPLRRPRRLWTKYTWFLPSCRVYTSYWGPLHTWDWEAVTFTRQALSLVDKAEPVQVHFTLRLRD